VPDGHDAINFILISKEIIVAKKLLLLLLRALSSLSFS
jgi:hypothetical protein